MADGSNCVSQLFLLQVDDTDKFLDNHAFLRENIFRAFKMAY